jgi:formylglycine-generating enzyme required for sulfatase activity
MDNYQGKKTLWDISELSEEKQILVRQAKEAIEAGRNPSVVAKMLSKHGVDSGYLHLYNQTKDKRLAFIKESDEASEQKRLEQERRKEGKKKRHNERKSERTKKCAVWREKYNRVVGVNVVLAVGGLCSVILAIITVSLIGPICTISLFGLPSSFAMALILKKDKKNIFFLIILSLVISICFDYFFGWQERIEYHQKFTEGWSWYADIPGYLASVNNIKFHFFPIYYGFLAVIALQRLSFQKNILGFSCGLVGGLVLSFGILLMEQVWVYEKPTTVQWITSLIILSFTSIIAAICCGNLLYRVDQNKKSKWRLGIMVIVITIIGAYGVLLSGRYYTMYRHEQRLAKHQRNIDTYNLKLSKAKSIPEMIKIPGGSFFMGCVSGIECLNDEKVHKVTVDSFYMSKYEVTFAQWYYCVHDGGCSHYPDDGYWDRIERGDLPVGDISWNDTQEYISWLSKKTGKHYRLPTEAEWEYAARAGTKTPFAFGDCLSANDANINGEWSFSDCLTSEIYREKTIKVGSFKPNSFGLYDMHGNVAEWVHDWYDSNYYKNSTANNPKGPASGKKRIHRGGAIYLLAGANYCRSAFRHQHTPDYRSDSVGFRLVMQY